MEILLHELARHTALAIQLIAVLVVVVGVIETLVAMLRAMLRGSVSNVERRAVWLSFGQWLVAALTFQLAADIVETTTAPTWNDVGRVAAVAVIRTFLTYFLDRDMDVVRERQERTGRS